MSLFRRGRLVWLWKQPDSEHCSAILPSRTHAMRFCHLKELQKRQSYLNCIFFPPIDQKAPQLSLNGADTRRRCCQTKETALAEASRHGRHVANYFYFRRRLQIKPPFVTQPQSRGTERNLSDSCLFHCFKTHSLSRFMCFVHLTIWTNLIFMVLWVLLWDLLGWHSATRWLWTDGWW